MSLSQDQVAAVLKKAVELYLSDLEAGYESDSYENPQAVIEDFGIYWENVDTANDALSNAAKEAAVSEEYQELLTWIDEKSQGKLTEKDLFEYWAHQDVQAVKDMTDNEMAEWLLDGVKYDRQHVMEQWNEMDPNLRSAYKEWMINYFATKEV